jgi:hypothetical protein
MIRIHPIHDRARVVVEDGYYADEHVLKVQVLDASGQWVEKGAHCVVENPEREAADLAAEFRAVAEAYLRGLGFTDHDDSCPGGIPGLTSLG